MKALAALAPAIAEIAILMDVCLVEKDHEMLVALGSREQVSNARETRLSALRVGPSKKLFGFLPGQLEAVQGRSDRLATAHQPEALADPADKAAQRPARRWISPGQGRRRGSSRRFRLRGAEKKGTAPAGAAESECVGTLGIVGVHPARHGVGTPARAQGHLRGAAVLGDVEQGKRPLARAGMRRTQRQVTQIFRRLTPARAVNS